jgi:hypothetical protein
MITAQMISYRRTGAIAAAGTPANAPACRGDPSAAAAGPAQFSIARPEPIHFGWKLL